MHAITGKKYPNVYINSIPNAIANDVNTIRRPLKWGLEISAEYTDAGALERPVAIPIMKRATIICVYISSASVRLAVAIKIHDTIEIKLMSNSVDFRPK